jgi:hypothetical protein
VTRKWKCRQVARTDGKHAYGREMSFEKLRKHFDDIHNMAVNCLEKLPDDKLHFKAHPELRTPAELFFHMYVNQDWYLKSIEKGGLELESYKKLLESVP